MMQGIFGGFGLGRRDLIVILVLFAVSRLVYALLGVHFDATTLPMYMQFLDEELLRTRLLESLWYYHANPPLLNLLAGIGLKLFGTHASLFFSAVFHALGMLTALSVYVLTLQLSNSRPAAVAVTAILVFSPSFVLYENWLMYSLPAAALLTCSAMLLYRYVSTQRAGWAFAFFLTLAVLLLTRSLFHLAWMILVAALLAAFMAGRRRQVLLAALAPVLIVGLWYGKNYYYFGVFSSSTWMGLGLSNISTLVATRDELQPLVADGRLSPFALVSRYEQRDLLFTSQELPPTGVPALDQIRKANGVYNFNSQQLIAINRYYIHDAIVAARTYPFNYVMGVYIANRLFFSPSNMNMYFSEPNRLAAQPMERLFNPLLYGVEATPRVIQQPHFGFSKQSFLEVNTSALLIAQWVLVLGYGYVQARRGLLTGAPPQRPRAIVIGFIVITALYLYAVGTALELAENYRYRFLIEPLFFVLTATAITSLVRVAKSKFGTRVQPTSHDTPADA